MCTIEACLDTPICSLGKLATTFFHQKVGASELYFFWTTFELRERLLSQEATTASGP
jgi:hypothetical protein